MSVLARLGITFVALLALFATSAHAETTGVKRVFADETRPYLQGARLTAWELDRDGIPCTLIADVAAASLIAAGDIDAVVVGADRVAANGDVANKVGTLGLAVVARHYGVPFYVAVPRSTLDPRTPTGAGRSPEGYHFDRDSVHDRRG